MTAAMAPPWAAAASPIRRPRAATRAKPCSRVQAPAAQRALHSPREKPAAASKATPLARNTSVTAIEWAKMASWAFSVLARVA